MQPHRRPRSNVIKQRSMPVTPTLVFVRAARLADLLDLARTPGQLYQVWDSEERRMVARGIPHFSVFRYNNGYPLIRDRDLDPLRVAEQKVMPKTKVKSFRPGEMVRYPAAGFEGLTGEVKGSKGRFAIVCFPGLAIEVKIEPRNLLSAA